MTALPKPAPREREPRRPIKRTKRPRRQRKSTPAQLAREADKLWSLVVRSVSPACEAWAIQPPRCLGSIQAAHGFSRRYRNTRWLPINGFRLCAAHHTYFTWRALEWDDWLRKNWGQEVYNDLRLKALRAFKPDVGAALEALRREAIARGITL